MVAIYAALIINHEKTKKTISQVPEQLREAVRQELRSRGYDENGKPVQ